MLAKRQISRSKECLHKWADVAILLHLTPASDSFWSVFNRKRGHHGYQAIPHPHWLDEPLRYRRGLQEVFAGETVAGWRALPALPQ